MRKEGWRIVNCHLLVIHGKAEKDAAKNVPAASNGCSSSSLQGHCCSGARDTHGTFVKMIMATSWRDAPPDPG